MSDEILSDLDDDTLARIYDEALDRLPSRAPIFLPTERMDYVASIRGVRRVERIYKRELNRVYRPQLKALREKHQGQDRCFIIGNGPSLNKTDLSMLRDEVTFAVNGFFFKQEELDWSPTYYVVEDHLVAEDRQRWINDLTGPTKLFPVYLSYCIEEADDTIFFNHRGRKSYPHGFDFSTDAEEITYAGCTVTFTCMQLAHYMGFKEIYLIGVDADYDIPADVDQGDGYNVGVLDMASDDPNHFHPDYFGKGFRWHDPQVSKMLEAYEEARKVIDQTGRRIFNATVGGQLEVFERVAFNSLFTEARAPDKVAKKKMLEEDIKPAPEPSKHYPKVLLYDARKTGSGRGASGPNCDHLGGWPASRVMQFHATGAERFGWYLNEHQRLDNAVDGALAHAEAFGPDVIIYRPTPDNMTLHAAAMKAIEALGVPFIFWMTDDWLEALARTAPDRLAELAPDIADLVARADCRLARGEALSRALGARYGAPFLSLPDGVLEKHWPAHAVQPVAARAFRIRHAGPTGTAVAVDNLVRMAAVVERLSQTHRILFEIEAGPGWTAEAVEAFAPFAATRLRSDAVPFDDYRDWLRGADLLFVTSGFDEAATDLARYALSGSLASCLASGVPILAHGPGDSAVMAALSLHDCADCVTEPNSDALSQALNALVEAPDRCAALGQVAWQTAFEAYNLSTLRERLRELTEVLWKRSFANRRAGRRLQDLVFPRAACARYDEVKMIFQLFDHARPGCMIDVGAHFGSSALPFSEQGWQIYCFEPDPDNREELKHRFGASPGVIIDPRAVGETPAQNVPFYTSPDSTGISGILPFHPSHELTSQTDVTTISDFVNDHAITHVDFLKIDVEGYDFGVLKGVPWDRLKPDVIVCEFEDAKTHQLGHTWRDMCEYLVARGYDVFVSEWHPIVRYGIAHDWHALKPYPCELETNKAWGNLLAFRQGPKEEDLVNALRKVLRTGC